MGLRAWLLLAVGVLYAVSIPWYREPDPSPEAWLGLPGWVAVAVACYVAAAVLNALAWLATDLDERDPPEDG